MENSDFGIGNSDFYIENPQIDLEKFGKILNCLKNYECGSESDLHGVHSVLATCYCEKAGKIY